jgi:hypothetical protein
MEVTVSLDASFERAVHGLGKVESAARRARETSSRA